MTDSATQTPPMMLPQGIADFKKLRDNHYYYVDKSLFIKRILEDGAGSILLPRPRRFGKTLNLSMLRYFFEKVADPDEQHKRHDLFRGLKIEQDANSMAHCGRYPVIFLTFKDVKEKTWDDTLTNIIGLIAKLYQEHAYLLDGDTLSEEEQETFQAILQRRADKAVRDSALLDLSMYLHRYHKQPVVILFDEYDSPVHEAYEHGFYKEATRFLGSFLSPAFKDNSHLFRGVLTGILRVTKESIFSSLNNLGVYSLIHRRYATDFGFTEDEVAHVVHLKGAPELLAGIREWYNGYQFGGHTIYNPWSVITYLNEPQEGLKSYWAKTSSNRLIQTCLLHNALNVRQELEQLLRGGTIDKPLDENLAMEDLAHSSEAVWNLLLFTGYLKAARVYTVEDRQWVNLQIPNREIQACLRDLVEQWFKTSLGQHTEVSKFLQALLQGEAEDIEDILQNIVYTSVSYHDTHAELFFHGLVLGLLVNLSATHEVCSNQESGFGRCDVMIIPKQAQQIGIVIEFKVVNQRRQESIEQACASAMQQIETRNYTARLVERQAQPIRLIAMAFLGKQVRVMMKLL